MSRYINSGSLYEIINVFEYVNVVLQIRAGTYIVDLERNSVWEKRVSKQEKELIGKLFRRSRAQ